jgi:hypothetical protein
MVIDTELDRDDQDSITATANLRDWNNLMSKLNSSEPDSTSDESK